MYDSGRGRSPQKEAQPGQVAMQEARVLLGAAHWQQGLWATQHALCWAAHQHGARPQLAAQQMML
jgi:hypothetical protein